MIVEGVAHPQPVGERARAVRLLGERGDEFAAHPLDCGRLKPRQGQRSAQQTRRLGEIRLQAAQTAADFVPAGGEPQIRDEIFEARLEGRGIVRAGTFVEQR